MSTPILVTKLYIPPPRPKIVLRPRLTERLNEGLSSGRKLTLISAPAGFGKTTLASEWITDCGRPTAWLSLDEGDNDPTRFLTYLIAALQTISANTGAGALAAGLVEHPTLPRLYWEQSSVKQSQSKLENVWHRFPLHPVTTRRPVACSWRPIR